MTDLPPEPPPFRQVTDQTLTPEEVRARLKRTTSACIANSAAATMLHERAASSPSTRGFRVPPKTPPPVTPSK